MSGFLSLGGDTFYKDSREPFPFMSPPVIAPLWPYLDRYGGGTIFYRVSNVSALLSDFNSLWEELNVGNLTNFIPTQLFIATWHQVKLLNTDYKSVVYTYDYV